ncbi:MAG: DUF4340 domain-containing protein [Methylobacillus sp.]|jgi:hypothetical protein|nr:DUF4340 domain-containing protein [Methylobacillus sp.]
MKSRWLVNLALLAVIVGLGIFLYLTPKKEETATDVIKVSAINSSAINKITIEFPAKNPVVFEKQDGHWRLVQPYTARAGEEVIGKLLAVLDADSTDKFDTADLARYGLNQPSLRLELNDKEMLFGTTNPVNDRQYIAFENAIYLVSTQFYDVAGTQIVEMLDKHLIAPGEEVVGFDFSHLEQWEETGLVVERDGANWKVSIPNAKPAPGELDDWFGDGWKTLRANSVEPYTFDSRKTYPYFEIILKDGKRIHVDKQLESPELVLARPDEGMAYHYAADLGFTLLNPPVGVPK